MILVSSSETSGVFFKYPATLNKFNYLLSGIKLTQKSNGQTFSVLVVKMSLLKSLPAIQLTARRGLLRQPSNIPYAGIYRKDGEGTSKDDLLVVQRLMNYHPGANVSRLL
jgi:hypothetical protein